MKTRILLTVSMMLMIVGAMAQKPTMVLTFTADNNGHHVPLNSILIENLTQGGDTTLYAPDTVLILDYITDMEEVSGLNGNAFSLSQNYPNPFEGKTTIDLLLPESENVAVIVSDIMGRELIRRNYRLEQGSHSFTFLPGGETLYFLTARSNQQSRTIKMFNSSSGMLVSGCCKLEYNGQQYTGAGEYKSGTALNDFVFDLGDQLRYTASSSLGERTITDFPAENQTYYFQYGSGGMPCPGMPTVTDIDGNVYNTVLIGTQCWMKENLKTTTYRNGTAIPNVADQNAWSNLINGAYVWYDNDISWKDQYGALYNGYSAVDTNGLCPDGWHVPSNDEWTALTAYIGGTSYPHGNELKSCRQVNSPLGGSCNTSAHPRWNEDNYEWGTDDYGFSALPGSARYAYDGFDLIGEYGIWWSSTAGSAGRVWSRTLSNGNGGVIVGTGQDKDGFSVRCLRD